MLAPETSSSFSARTHADRLVAAAARADGAARARLGGAINDLFRPPENRLSDREHALMTRMLAGLVAEIERPLRSSMAQTLAAIPTVAQELADKNSPIAALRLPRSRMLRDSDLARTLLRRCDEHHLSCRLQQAYSGADGAIDGLSLHPDPDLRAALSALLLDESRRVDLFGEPLLRLDDLPLGLLHRLGWWVSALLRDHLLDRGIDAEAADHALAIAVLRLVEGHDSSRAVDSHAARLVQCLEDGGLLDAILLDAVLRDGQLALWVAGLAHRSGLDVDAVWIMLGDADGSRLTLLMRAIGLERSRALAMLALLFAARFGTAAEIDLRLTDAAAAYEAIEPLEAETALRAYRQPAAKGGDGLA